MRVSRTPRNIAAALALMAVGAAAGFAYGNGVARAPIPHGPLSSFN